MRLRLKLRLRRGRSIRLLLGEAMQGAKTKNEIDSTDSNHRSIPEKFCENAKRKPILGIVEGGDQDGRVADVKICVACRKAIALEVERGGHWQSNHFRFGAVFQ